MKILEDLKRNCNKESRLFYLTKAMKELGYSGTSSNVKSVLLGILKNHQVVVEDIYIGSKGRYNTMKVYLCNEETIEHLFYYATTSKAKELRTQALEEFYTDVRESSIINDRNLTKLFLQVAEKGYDLKLFQNYIIEQ